MVLAQEESARFTSLARGVAADNALRVLGTTARPYAVSALKELVSRYSLRKVENGGGDDAFVAELIRSERLIPNLAVEFQSKHRLDTNAVVGFEALTRLAPRRAISPEMIFSQLVDLEVESAATRVVIDRACRFAAALRDAGRPHSVAINCSAAVMTRGDFRRDLCETVKRYRLASRRITVEITENSRFADFDRLQDEIRRLEAFGTGIAIDDFGTGMANLDRVGRLPLTELKIDKNIFWAFTEGRFPMAILNGILEYCRNNGIESVIEGIETKHHLDQAKSLGADYGQGFYWGRAVPPQFLLPTWR